MLFVYKMKKARDKKIFNKLDGGLIPSIGWLIWILIGFVEATGMLNAGCILI